MKEKSFMYLCQETLGKQDFLTDESQTIFLGPNRYPNAQHELTEVSTFVWVLQRI